MPAIYMPESDVLKATGVVMHIKDNWWVVDPDRGLIFYIRKPSILDAPFRNASPQCGKDREQITRLGGRQWPDAVIKLIPSVLYPVTVDI